MGASIDLSAEKSLQPDGSEVKYEWAILEKPDSSQLSIVEPTLLNTSIIPDKAGYYQFVFTMTDETNQAVSADTVGTFVSGNPIAYAGEDIAVELGERPTISGRQSSDPEDDRLTYRWTLVEQPTESTVELRFPTSSRPILDPNVEGVYAVKLIVSDGFSESKPDTVLVKVAPISTSLAAITNVDPAIKLFPNPSSDILNVQCADLPKSSAVNFVIYDFMGKPIVARTVFSISQEEIIQIPLPKDQFTSGIYFLRVDVEEDHRPYYLSFLVETK